MSDYDKKIFARNLCQHIQRDGITQKDIAQIVGVSGSTVSSWCDGSKMPRMDKVQALANYFGILKSDLIEQKEKPTPVSESGLDAEKLAFIEKLKSMDSDTVAALNKIADSIIAKRD